jgi:hypothetical protein
MENVRYLFHFSLALEYEIKRFSSYTHLLLIHLRSMSKISISVACFRDRIWLPLGLGETFVSAQSSRSERG